LDDPDEQKLLIAHQKTISDMQAAHQAEKMRIIRGQENDRSLSAKEMEIGRRKKLDDLQEAERMRIIGEQENDRIRSAQELDIGRKSELDKLHTAQRKSEADLSELKKQLAALREQNTKNQLTDVKKKRLGELQKELYAKEKSLESQHALEKTFLKQPLQVRNNKYAQDASDKLHDKANNLMGHFSHAQPEKPAPRQDSFSSTKQDEDARPVSEANEDGATVLARPAAQDKTPATNGYVVSHKPSQAQAPPRPPSVQQPSVLTDHNVVSPAPSVQQPSQAGAPAHLPQPVTPAPSPGAGGTDPHSAAPLPRQQVVHKTGESTPTIPAEGNPHKTRFIPRAGHIMHKLGKNPPPKDDDGKTKKQRWLEKSNDASDAKKETERLDSLRHEDRKVFIDEERAENQKQIADVRAKLDSLKNNKQDGAPAHLPPPVTPAPSLGAGGTDPQSAETQNSVPSAPAAKQNSVPSSVTPAQAQSAHAASLAQEKAGASKKTPAGGAAPTAAGTPSEKYPVQPHAGTAPAATARQESVKSQPQAQPHAAGATGLPHAHGTGPAHAAHTSNDPEHVKTDSPKKLSPEELQKENEYRHIATQRATRSRERKAAQMHEATSKQAESQGVTTKPAPVVVQDKPAGGAGAHKQEIVPKPNRYTPETAHSRAAGDAGRPTERAQSSAHKPVGAGQGQAAKQVAPASGQPSNSSDSTPPLTDDDILRQEMAQIHLHQAVEKEKQRQHEAHNAPGTGAVAAAAKDHAHASVAKHEHPPVAPAKEGPVGLKDKTLLSLAWSMGADASAGAADAVAGRRLLREALRKPVSRVKLFDLYRRHIDVQSLRNDVHSMRRDVHSLRSRPNATALPGAARVRRPALVPAANRRALPRVQAPQVRA